MASVRDLETRIGRTLDFRRFRANILVEGLPPWAELDWLDRDVTIGNLRFTGMRLTRRCPTTEVNPDTASRDINVPQELMRSYGHLYLGIYLKASQSGHVRVGDDIQAPN